MLSIQDVPTLAADFPSFQDQLFLHDEVHLSAISRSNSSSSSQGCTVGDGKVATTLLELPPPHRFIRNSNEAKKFSFKTLNQSSALNMSYLATYRRAQGQLHDDIPAMRSQAKACDQDKLYKLASEIARFISE